MNKKRIFICILGLVLLAGLAKFAFTRGCTKKAPIVAFYDIDEAWQASVRQILEAENSTSFVYKNLSENDILDKNLSKKIDILICKNGASVQRIKNQAIPLSNAIKERIPQTIKTSDLYCRDGSTVVMPLVIDNFEMAVLRTAVNRYQLPLPQTIAEISDFAHTARFYYPIPLVIAGAKDENVSSLLTKLVISAGGIDAYNQLVMMLKTTTDFSQIFDYKVGGAADSSLKVSDLLGILKKWQEEGYLASNWLTLTPEMTANLIDDNRVTVSFMTLSEHRSKPQPNISYYTELPFPEDCTATKGSVQPVYVAMALNDIEPARISLNRLSLAPAQESLSLVSRLGPAMLQGTSCDIQADDARYIAATSEAGPLPDLATAAFEKSSDRHAFAQAIREWF